MLHEPAVEMGQDHSIRKKTKLGIILFLIYLLIYTGFVLIGTFFPKLLGEEFSGGLNLAFLYGMGLIILAALMGLVYNYYCTRFEKEMNKEVNL